MEKIAIVILADTETADGLGRIVNGLAAAKEYLEAGIQVSITFSGAGTKWPAVLTDPEHPAHGLYEATKHKVRGACLFCATAFKQKDALERCELKLLGEYGENMSYLQLTNAGNTVLTF